MQRRHIKARNSFGNCDQEMLDIFKYVEKGVHMVEQSIDHL